MSRLVPATYVQHWVSAVGALQGVLRALGIQSPEADTCALSGHAFRFAVTSAPEGAIGRDGPNHFSSRAAVTSYEGLGLRFEAIEVAASDPRFARKREEALKRLRKSLNRGSPAIVYGLHVPQFGVLRGYDDANLIAGTALSQQYGERIAVTQWPLPGEPVRAFVPEKQVKVDRGRVVSRLLHWAVEYARRGERESPAGSPPAATGLAAYERWAQALESAAPVSPHGQAYCIQALQAARGQAAAFLRDEARQQEAFTAAAAAYGSVVIELSRMATLFPYPNGGDVISPQNRRVGAGYVRRAQAAEEAAVQALEHALAGG
jgi:hypothetical protein